MIDRQEVKPKARINLILMQLPPEIVAELQRRIEDLRVRNPIALSKDGKALRVDGSIGYDCWMSPDGDVYMETYDLFTEESPVIDRSRRAQILTLVLGSRTVPQLKSLWPSRPDGASDCLICKGIGRFLNDRIICDPCCGLGWIDNNSGQTAG